MTGGSYSHLLIDKAQEMRKNPTKAENILWSELRSQALDHKFRQQHLIADFIVDFVCLSKKLVIEVDGEYDLTDDQIQLDNERTIDLNKLGYKVIRFSNNEVQTNIHGVLNKIQEELSSQEKTQNSNSPITSPSPSGRAGEGNAYVQYFLDIVLERDVRNQAGISDFLSFWDKNGEKFSIPSPEGKNAVRIMTIHKSKGLEFPVVIMPFAEEDYSRKPKDKLWLNAEEEEFGLPKVLIDNSSAVEGFGDDASSVYSQKKQEELLDNINVLYVALTRAEEQLYVISNRNLTSKGEVKKNDMSAFFINYLISKGEFAEDRLEYEFGNTTKLSPENPKTSALKTIPLVTEILNPKSIKIAKREALMWGTQQQAAIEYGNVIHEILSFVKTKKDLELAITKSIESGLITVNQKEIVSKTIQEIINHKELESYFLEGNEVLNEQTIIQKEGKSIKPDRMVLTKDKEVFLLDYKTGSHDPKYELQLANYQDAIELMGFKVTKKALIYIGEGIKVVNL
jgi:very-short-patch-repair endonuclease